MTLDAKATSSRQRLLNLAQSTGDDYNQILVRYAGLRFLARLANSDHAGRFLLKGATMFLVWNGSIQRPTRDIDLLGFVEHDAASLSTLIREICIQEVEVDGMLYDPESVQVAPIREETAYGGLRCLIRASLGTAKMRIQLDIGFGDEVTPHPSVVEIPRLLDDEVRRELSAYTRETVVAEKLEAMVKLGLANSRMKDYFDLDILFKGDELKREILADALIRTFARRKTTLESNLPFGLTEAFWADEMAQRRWKAFTTKNRLSGDTLEEVCCRIGNALSPILEAIAMKGVS